MAHIRSWTISGHAKDPVLISSPMRLYTVGVWVLIPHHATCVLTPPPLPPASPPGL